MTNTSWDRKDVDLTMASRKVQQREAQIEASKTVRRRRVQIEPDEAFADIEAIRKAQSKRVVSEESEESEESEALSEMGSTIVVATYPN
jgi:hypothetical protein